MIDKEKVLKGLECCCAISGRECRQCPYSDECIGIDQPYGMAHLAADALEQIKVYQQLLEWAVECDFGYDNIPILYEPQYKVCSMAGCVRNAALYTTRTFLPAVIARRMWKSLVHTKEAVWYS